ncbi:VOC family protein [Kitasatospora sp. NPDC094015]|uniref:VOC family protein n=1 Tax=Kitasatospora sp. NPDC094015 TaxID=3155205 RepID=UPI0033258EF3
MLDHISLQCADLAAATAFYDTVLEPLGGRRLMKFDGAVGYGIPPSPTLWLGPQTSGEGFRETHLALRAPDRAAVVAFYTLATAAGATALHPPQEWPDYHPGYFAAFVRDPDGNNLEAVCHLAP